MKRSVLLPAALMALALFCSSSVQAGKYCLAFWRETGFYEKGGIGGNHVINIHVWDENGNPLPGKHLYVGSLDFGATDSNGQIEIPLYQPNAYSFRVVDGSHLSDTTPGFSTTRAPDWGHYCFECGFVYVSDTSNLPVFDLTYDGVLNSSSANHVCNNLEMSAPRTRSLAFCSTRPDPGYYCSDGTDAGNTVPMVGQTFRATGNRVVAAKFHALGGSAQYICRIREGGPTGAYVGSPATSPFVGTYEYGKTLTKWGLNSVQVVPGNTYFLEITKVGGANFYVNRVTNDNYTYGSYYEGTTAFANREIRGEVLCATVGPPPDTGSIAGVVKDTSGSPISGAVVATNTGGYSTTTDSLGNYSLINVAAGTYNVTASKAGFEPKTLSNISVTIGQTTYANFSLTPYTGTISGFVRDAGGAGISGASVSTTTGGYSTTTDSNGNYTLNNVAVGIYSVTASKTGFDPRTNTGVTVTMGETTSCNFVLSCSAPSFTSHPASQVKTICQSAVFSVSVTGSAPFTYQWKKNGSIIAGATASSYSIHSVSPSDAGSYTCTVTNSCGSATSNAAVLAVNTGALGVWDADKVWTASMNPVKLSGAKWGIETGTGTTELWGTSYSLGTSVYDRNNQILALVGDNNGNTSNSSKIKYRTDSGEGWTFDNTKTTAIKAGFYAIDSASAYPSLYIRLANTGCQVRYDDVQQAWVPGDDAVLGPGSPSKLSVPLRKWHYVRFQLEPSGNWQVWLDEDQNQRMWGISTGGGGGYLQLGCLGSTSSNVEFALDYVAWGQGEAIASFGTGTISGTVKDRNNIVLPGVTISAADGAYTTVTASNGTYSIPSAASGVYTITASKTGYTTQTLTGVTVAMGGTAAANFTLSLSAQDVANLQEAKALADGTRVRITGRVVSARFFDCFYLTETSRTAGIKVTGATASEGSTVTVTGTLATVNGERVITDAVVE